MNTEDVVKVVRPELALAAVAICRGIDQPDELRAALERARVVQVLDNWRARSAGSLTTVGEYRAGGCFCTLAVGFGGKVRAFDGATPDEARAKAAQAIEAGEDS